MAVEIHVPSDIDEAYRMAAEAKPELDSFGGRLAERFGVEYVSAPLKGRERAEEKVQTKYRGDVSRLTDIARCRIVCDTLEQIDCIKDEVKKYTVPTCEKDRMDDPNERGYRDVKFTFPVPNNGHVVEMQLQLRDFVAADKESHAYYEEIRKIEAGAQNRDLTKREQKRRNLLKKLSKDVFQSAVVSYNEHTEGRKLRTQNEIEREKEAKNQSKEAGVGRESVQTFQAALSRKERI